MEMHMGMQGIEILEKLGIEMSQFFAFVQFMGIIIPIISVALILQKEQSKAATYLILAEVSCIVMNAAYLLTLRSAAHDAAMLTYKMQYLAVASFYFFLRSLFWPIRE